VPSGLLFPVSVDPTQQAGALPWVGYVLLEVYNALLYACALTLWPLVRGARCQTSQLCPEDLL
jgi:hypothetical protein